MRTTPYGEPSSREIDALRQPPLCPRCSAPSDSYGELCAGCQEFFDSIATSLLEAQIENQQTQSENG